jgi:4-carboxymuconolactone decarboxylase
MNMATDLQPGLGGRLPLLDPINLVGKQRELYEKILADVVPWADTAGFLSKDQWGHLIGPFNAPLYSPEMAGAFLALQKIEAEHTSLSKQTRQVVILSVGSVWKAPYEIYAHSAEASKAGLSPDQVDKLVAGHPDDSLSEVDQIAQRFTVELTRDHVVEDGTYILAQKALGDKGLVEMLVLIGCYLSVCALLNAFRIPVPSSNTKTEQKRAL